MQFKCKCKSLAVLLQSLMQQVSGIATGEDMNTDDASHGAVPAEASSAISASRLSRLFFILGQVAIQHLVSLLQPFHVTTTPYHVKCGIAQTVSAWPVSWNHHCMLASHLSCRVTAQLARQ